MNKYKNVFIVGIKGVAMCHIAVILKKMGVVVTGTDVNEEFITDQVLNKNQIASLVGFDPSLLPKDTDLVLYSAAHGGTDNPIVQAANTRGIAVLSQGELIGELLKEFKNVIAVCGTHGKTTTSSLLTYALIKLGSLPSYLTGSSDFSGGGEVYTGGDYNRDDYFVIEADEYGVNPPKDKTPKFYFLKPTHILVLNLDYDHPDMYADIEEVKHAYHKFLDQELVRVTYCADDAILSETITTLRDVPTDSFGLSNKSKLRITNYELRDGKTFFSVKNEYESIDNIELSVYGEKNVSNAAGVISILLQLGFAPDEIKRAVAGFTGPKRRLELKDEHNGTYLYDDYAHHPAEIVATIAALRQRFPQKRVIVIFQPHTFSRTQSLKREFTAALASSDLAFVLPIFASAREKEGENAISSADISNGITVFALENKSSVTSKLKQFIRGGEVIVTMGAGDVYKLADDIIELIQTL